MLIVGSKMPICCGCGGNIKDRYLLKVTPDLEWHTACLKCTVCNSPLHDNKTCFIRDEKAYCKMDYDRLFVARCHGCDEILDRNILVMRAKDNRYHVDCFRCVACKRRLTSGDVFALTNEGLFCEDDHNNSDSSLNGDEEEDLKDTIKENCVLKNSKIEKSPEEQLKREKDIKVNGTYYLKNKKDKPTRVRTVLNEKQLSTLKACYSANPRPDASMKEQLVELTGLSPRVIRVWFQNKRCKDKKKSLLMKGEVNDHNQSYSMHSSPLSDELSNNGFTSLSNSLSLLAHASQQNLSINQPLHFSVPSTNEQVLGSSYRNNIPMRDFNQWRSLTDYSFPVTNQQVTPPGAYQQLAHFPSDPGIRLEPGLARI